MITGPASQARAGLYPLIDETASSQIPIQITGKRANAVLVSKEDWSAIQETLYLLSIPGMRESIEEGLNASREECAHTLEGQTGRWVTRSRHKTMDAAMSTVVPIMERKVNCCVPAHDAIPLQDSNGLHRCGGVRLMGDELCVD
jgi:prevent-host-death family protein